MIFIYVLVAIALSDQPNTQTIRYFDSVSECNEYRNKIESQVDKTYVKLDCVPIKALNDQ